jgi:hypothetical protein
MNNRTMHRVSSFNLRIGEESKKRRLNGHFGDQHKHKYIFKNIKIHNLLLENLLLRLKTNCAQFPSHNRHSTITLRSIFMFTTINFSKHSVFMNEEFRSWMVISISALCE